MMTTQTRTLRHVFFVLAAAVGACGGSDGLDSPAEGSSDRLTTSMFATLTQPVVWTPLRPGPLPVGAINALSFDGAARYRYTEVVGRIVFTGTGYVKCVDLNVDCPPGNLESDDLKTHSGTFSLLANTITLGDRALQISDVSSQQVSLDGNVFNARLPIIPAGNVGPKTNRLSFSDDDGKDIFVEHSLAVCARNEDCPTYRYKQNYLPDSWTETHQICEKALKSSGIALTGQCYAGHGYSWR